MDVLIIIDAALSTEPLAYVENSSRLDELLFASSIVALELTVDDIVGLESLKAESFAEFLIKQYKNKNDE